MSGNAETRGWMSSRWSAGIENDRGDGLHGVFDAEEVFFALLFHGGEVEAVLTGEQVEDGDGLEAAGDE